MPVFPRAETRFGPMFTLQGDAVIGRSLRLYGEFAGEEVDSILAFLRPGDHVLDLGANIGVHSLALAQTVGPTGRVILVEPQHYCFQLLIANVTLNQLSQVHALRAAVGETRGACVVPRIDPTRRHNAGATTVSTTQAQGQGQDVVPMNTVDSPGLAGCDLIKIDTEGFKDRVLAGAQAMLQTFSPVI
jgi:FkbM family methyltransferase